MRSQLKPSIGSPEAFLRNPSPTENGWLIADKIATLREAFQNTPAWLGFNIELKYPTDAQLAVMPTRFYSRNYFCDEVLRVIHRLYRTSPLSAVLQPSRLRIRMCWYPSSELGILGGACGCWCLRKRGPFLSSKPGCVASCVRALICIDIWSILRKRTLQVVLQEGHKRKVIFSSFDPDCATLLSLKCARYPVFFLSAAGSKHYADPRMNSLEAALIFAKSSKLQARCSSPGCCLLWPHHDIAMRSRAGWGEL